MSKMTGKFKVGDKVTIIGISNVMPDIADKVVGTTTVITEVGKYFYNCVNGIQFYEEQLIIAKPKLKGHIWLIVEKDTGKVLEGRDTRAVARMYKNCYSDRTEIVKYV